MGFNPFGKQVHRRSDVVMVAVCLVVVALLLLWAVLPADMAHDWTEPDDGVDVRHVQPYEAVKSYRCPGCDHEIRPGEGHEAVVPRDAPEERRHWHTGCWHREERRVKKRPR